MSLTKWLSGIKGWLSGTQAPVEWLSPRMDNCTACGQWIRSKAPAPPTGGSSLLLRRSLCERCLASIPWLNDIQCGRCGRGIACEDCVREPNRHFQVNRSAVSYDPVMRSWLALYKYRGLERLGPILGEMLLPVYDRLTAAAGGKWDAITFVPISEVRAVERGFNQAEALGGYIAGRYGVPLYSLLERTRHAEKMSFKTRSQRLRDVQGLFTPKEEGFGRLDAGGSRVADPDYCMNVLLVDDIYTTGSTSGACAEALKEGGRRIGANINVYVLTWARS